MTQAQEDSFTPTLVGVVDAMEDSLIRSGRAQTLAWTLGDALYADDAFRNQVLELFSQWRQHAGQD